MELKVLIPVHSVITLPTFIGFLYECIWYLVADATLKCQIRIISYFQSEILVEVLHLGQITIENTERYIEAHLCCDITIFVLYHFKSLDNVVLTVVVRDCALANFSFKL